MNDYERRDYDRLREEFGKLEEENRQHLEYIGKLEGMTEDMAILLIDMWTCLHNESCEPCKRYDECERNMCEFYGRMRKLGINAEELELE